jgi:TRAP-type uncharacterized transport system substrate-binding protein
MNRRHLVRLGAAALAGLIAGAHTPYGQWTVYRQRNLFIVASRTDPRAVALTRAVVKALAEELPESHARLTRASDPVRIASLLATGQLDVAIISREQALFMMAGSGEFRAVGPLSVRSIAELGGYLLVALASFQDRHAFLLAKAIGHMRPGLTLEQISEPSPIPVHLGAADFYAGNPLKTQQSSP